MTAYVKSDLLDIAQTRYLMKVFCKKNGFTLIEVLVVIAILAILFSLVLIAINPARQFSQANNTKRHSDVNALLNAIHQYAADNRGALPTGITTSVQNIKTGGADICSAIVPTYIAALPTDPTTGTTFTNCSASYDTGYTVVLTASGSGNRITVAAPAAELGQTISVSR